MMEDLTGSFLGLSSLDELMVEWKTRKQAIIDSAVAVQSIPAPTFQEATRADYIAARFSELGLADVSRDHVNNVYGRFIGADPQGSALLISGHMDTIFPLNTALTVTYDDKLERVYGPGIGDNSLSITAMFALIEAFTDHNYTPEVDIIFVATACEEGLGNLVGMRQVISRYEGRIGAAIILEGSCFGSVINAGLVIHRFKVVIEGPGGHSWSRSSSPSAVHKLMQVGAALIERIKLPDSPRTTLNIGLIEGGISVNTRAPSASMTIDLRSEDADTLALVENDIFALIETFMTEPGVTFTIEMVGERPGGYLDDQHPLVRQAVRILHHLGIGHAAPSISSTDANLLLDSQIPTICMGITTGGDAHTLKEYINTKQIPYGMAALTALVIMAAREMTDWRCWPLDGEIKGRGR